MKARKVSALRERGLRPDVCREAEPQVDGDTIARHHLNNREAPINSMKRKTDTMKTYILRDPNAVEPQKAQFLQPQKAQHPSAPTSLADVSSQSSQPGPAAAPCALFIGLDVHNDSIAVSLAPSDSTEVRRYGLIGGSHEDVLRLLKKLQAAHPGATLTRDTTHGEIVVWPADTLKKVATSGDSKPPLIIRLV
jgi:hypothetical protein